MPVPSTQLRPGSVTPYGRVVPFVRVVVVVPGSWDRNPTLRFPVAYYSHADTVGKLAVPVSLRITEQQVQQSASQLPVCAVMRSGAVCC